MLLRDFLLRIHLCNGIGMKTESKIYKHYQQIDSMEIPNIDDVIRIGEVKPSFQDMFRLSYKTLMRSSSLVEQIVDNEKWICISDQIYPIQLKESFEPPLIIFYRGNLSLLNQKLLAIVGSRTPTEYSFNCLKSLITQSFSHKITIVSGLAKGVDTLAHQCAIANDINTIAVIGTGLNIAYPRENVFLQNEIAKNHLLLSEYPNNTPGYRNQFPERNRIIAGLVESILVTEAKKRSGSLITANLALQNNRNVLAIPGRIDSLLSEGTNELILAGAKPILNESDLFEELSFDTF
ncbi:DNA-processing protein DprA [Lentilactobacillus laojiaonis]|uniref:DNA-processing protein DprA n=1 Tax=Lentilactobacillus laojiaonis TaxID=2883998 RepID=UPI001D0B2074|nr:DNA-processing protein DprA [Lentilactobacillus laojiaonis]UDM31585.1 DNA-processing protein DprA [Lentilactobacillus laojiaonis]